MGPRILPAAFTSSRARSPCVTTIAPIKSPSPLRHVPVDGPYPISRAPQIFAELLRHGHRAVAAAGATNRDGQVGLSLLDEPRHEERQEGGNLSVVIAVVPALL